MAWWRAPAGQWARGCGRLLRLHLLVLVLPGDLFLDLTEDLLLLRS